MVETYLNVPCRVGKGPKKAASAFAQHKSCRRVAILAALIDRRCK